MKAGQKFAAFVVLEGALRSLGLQTAQGLLVAAPFYWNLNDETRAWSAKFAKRMGVRQLGIRRSCTALSTTISKPLKRPAHAIQIRSWLRCANSPSKIR